MNINANIRLLIIILIAVLSIALTTLYLRSVNSADKEQNNKIFVSGRIEGDDALIAAKIAGRVLEINFREGDQVKTGDVIAQLDDEQLRAREEQAQANLQQTIAQLRRIEQQTAVLTRQLEQSRLEQQQSLIDSMGRIKRAEADVASAEAALAQAEAVYQQANYDAERINRLAQDGVESQRNAHQATKLAEAQSAAVIAAKKQIDATQGILIATRATATNSQILEAASRAIQVQIEQAQSEIVAAQSDVDSARAQLKAAIAARNDLKIVAPFDGTVITRAIEPGEVVAAGSAIINLVNLNKIYLRAFVPADQIGNVRLGQSAQLFLDNHPDQPIDAIVTRIDPAATFTPENTYFREDRIRQVFGIKLEIKANNGAAKPGMPADATLFIK